MSKKKRKRKKKKKKEKKKKKKEMKKYVAVGRQRRHWNFIDDSRIGETDRP